MASTYSPALRLELMATGDQSGTWGDTTNTNLGTLLEQAITGYLSVAQGDVANLTLTTTNGASDQARNAVIRITGALTATRNVVIQTANKLYTIANDTTGGFSIVVKTSAGTGVSVPPGAMVDVYSDGTNAVQAANYWTGSIGGIAYLDAGAAVGPNYDLFRDSTSPAISDILGRLTFNGRDSAGNKQEYGSIETTITSPTSTTEGGSLDFYATVSGTRTRLMSATGTGVAVVGTLSSTGNLAVTAGTATISSTASDTLLSIVSTDVTANSGPSLELYRNSASPAASDVLGRIFRYGKDGAGNKQEYASDIITITDTTSGSEDATWEDRIVVAGTPTTILTRNSTGIAVTGAINATSTAADTVVRLTSTDAGVASGPNLELYRNSASPAASDVLGRIFRYGQDGAGNKQEYASDIITIVDTTSGSEDATWEDQITIAGTPTTILTRGALAAGTASPSTIGLPLGQLSFPATQNASTNANTLDDYEEGSWTPTVGGTSTYTAQNGRYVKIGKQVWARGSITINSLGTGSASTISGLPYASASLGFFQAGTVGFFDTLAINQIFLSCAAADNGTTVRFFGSAAAGVSMTADPGIFGNGARVDFAVTYEAAA